MHTIILTNSRSKQISLMGGFGKFLSRSFSRYERKKMGCRALAGCFLIVWSICTIFRPYIGPHLVLNLRLSVAGDIGLEILPINDTNQSKPIETIQRIMEPICNFTSFRSNFCEAVGDIRVYGANSTVYYASPHQTTNISTENTTTSWNLKPYARKADSYVMSMIKTWYITNHHDPRTSPSCNVTHKVPAIIFSSGGYAGNHFHAFTDVLIPLFLASRRFNGEVQFLITNYKAYWHKKFRVILAKLSNYEVIDIDNEERIHCFPSIRIGLERQQELDMDPSLPPHLSFDDFRSFLRDSYSLNRTTAIKLQDAPEGKKPRLLIISRKGTRTITNEGNIVRMARKLGYEVVVAEMTRDTSLSDFSQLVNSCDAFMGVHGAGLTNIVFLPDNAIFIQIVPLGNLEWLSRIDYGSPAMNMNLKYLEYSIKESESSLSKQYPRDHVVLKNPQLFLAQGWDRYMSVYLEKQDVMLDVKRFRTTLVKALELLHENGQHAKKTETTLWMNFYKTSCLFPFCQFRKHEHV